jgi:hypothetical protein
VQTKTRVGRRVAVAVAAAAMAWSGTAPADAVSAGSGAVKGEIRYGEGGVPPLGAPCRPTSFSLHETVAYGSVAHENFTAFVGAVQITGTGSAVCETASAGDGNLTLLVKGFGTVNPNSTIHCLLTGSFIRVLNQASVLVGGYCTINGVTTSAPVLFKAEITLAPNGTGAGVTSPVMSATFAGDFAVVG